MPYKAQAKRQGKVVAADGTISGSIDPTKQYYRALNTVDINLLPTKYSGNTLVQNTHPSTGLAVRTTLKAGTIFYDGGKDQNP